MSLPTTERPEAWLPEPTPWGWRDLFAILVWTLALAAFFHKLVGLRETLFYFDITEINYPYRDFFAKELRQGRFSRWFPGLYCGFPLYSESQAGYLHPLKYLFYPWLPTWQAFNLDTIASIWLTGMGTFLWLRRHVRAAGAFTGAAVFGLGGFVWAHFVHTSMINSLASIPFILWALETGWERGRWWPIVIGSVSLACQVFSGHLQDTILTSSLVFLYGLYRAATEQELRSRVRALTMALGLIALAGLLGSVQGLPSKELHGRSPRAEGLTWEEITYGSWHPELLPTLIFREAYGTMARDTDWMDGFYPYHEMNIYLGAIAFTLAILGAGAYRDRWVAFWVGLAGLAFLLMLGRFTMLFDFAHRIPILGSGRIPVRYHLWVTVAASALSAVGVDRLARPGTVRLRTAALALLLVAAASIPILIYAYDPVWTTPNRWRTPYHLARFRWLGSQLLWGLGRTGLLVGIAWSLMATCVRIDSRKWRGRLASLLPALVILDLLGAHRDDVPSIDPRYWTVPPESARVLQADPEFIRLFSFPVRASNEPGFASEPIDFMSVRDTLSWSLPPVWDLATAIGETPMLPRRLLAFTDTVLPEDGRFDIQSVTHLVSGTPMELNGERSVPVGSAHILRYRSAQPRARLMGRPIYATSETDAIAALEANKPSLRERVVVEDPSRPLSPDSDAAGRASILRDRAELVEVETESNGPAYLVLTDTFDPGWSATVDGKPATIHPAYVAFRAVYVPKGRHIVQFTYRPSGFSIGLAISLVGIVICLVLCCWKGSITLGPEHDRSRLPQSWPLWGLLISTLIVLGSSVEWDQKSGLRPHPRWTRSFHRFTWGAGIEGIVPRTPKGAAPARYGPSHP